MNRQDRLVEPPRTELLLCYCPEWCESGYQVAEYTGKRFYYAEQSNDMFDECVQKWSLFEEAE